MKKTIVGLIVIVLISSLMLMACGSKEKGPAELALNAAEKAIDATKEQAAKYVPELVNSLENALASAKEKFNKKDYKAALEEAKALPAKAKEVLDAARAKMAELAKQWEEYSQEIPKLIEHLKGKVDTFSKSAKLPANLTADKFNEIKSWVSSASEEWGKALESFKAGSVAEAVSMATVVKEKAMKAMEALGISVPAVTKT
ncbi:MAG TPA: hypothetical protein PKY58_02050 [Syntrophales bacterium]|nr:hypothetical protein [Syntrophales bacterium]HPX56590.1 hypothetical protein [Syntrophales bacterium]HQN77294.1 hypothetical protein [Syntrophales bacterium]HQQ26282.1 hypothetical protein [Syntrophales bacterium]